jgi:hypothetical protein
MKNESFQNATLSLSLSLSLQFAHTWTIGKNVAEIY